MDNATTTSSPISSVAENELISKEALFIIKAINIAILTQTFSVFGSITNIINMIVFIRIGFSETINISLMALAVSDFGSCFVLIWRNIALNPWFQQINNLPFDPNTIYFLSSLWPHVAFVSITKLLTAFISIERCLCVALPLKVKSIITKSRVKIVVVFIYTLIILTFLPVFYTKRYVWKFSPDKNRTILIMTHAKERNQIEPVVYNVINFGYSLTPFFGISISTIFLVIALQKNTKWRQGTMSSESKISAKEAKVSRMVITISTIFIACFCPHTIRFIVPLAMPALAIDGEYKVILPVIGSFVFMLQTLNSSCNIFVYYLNSSVYNKTLKQLLVSCRLRKAETTQEKK